MAEVLCLTTEADQQALWLALLKAEAKRASTKCPEPGCGHPVSEHRERGGCMHTKRSSKDGALTFCGCTRTFS